MTFPTPNPVLSLVGGEIATLLGAITYLQSANGGTVVRVAEPKDLIELSAYSAPFAIIVPNGEILKTAEDQIIGGALFETSMSWSIYLGASSFSHEGEGLTGSVVGDPGIEAMIDDVISVLTGQIVSFDPASKLFPANPFHRRYLNTANLIVWEMNWRNSWQRKS